MARAISGNHLLRAHRDPIVAGDLVCIRMPHSKRPHHPPTTPLPVTQPGHMHHHDRDPEGGHAQPLLEGAPSVSPIRVRVALAKRVEKGAVPAARRDRISMHSECTQNALSMQSVCNHIAIIEQSACHQRTISVREVGEEPFGREEELGGGCRRVVWHAERRLRNRDSDQQVHSACTRHAISVQSECNQQMHSACTRHANSEPARRRPRAPACIAIRMQSECNLNAISEPARPRPRAPACIGAREARTADQGAAASSCAWRGGRRR